MKFSTEILFYLAFLLSTHQASLFHSSRSEVSSVLDAVMLPIRPFIEAGSDKCESLKSFFGLTYNQIQEKTNLGELLKVYYISKDGKIQLNLNDVNKLKMNKEDATSIVILIHGFMESSDGLMVKSIAQELLKKDNVNVLALDSRKVINFEYLKSTTYARLLGNILGLFLINILNGGEDASRMSLVGHSLGAHIAGMAGKTVHNRTGQLIGRITGLDPAGPCYNNIDTDGRLDSTDAAFVDVIHTNAGALGLKEPVGHIDFYPNNGMWQPGCVFVTCDHSRAWELFLESINSPDLFPARKCGSWSLFKSGGCANNEEVYMGVYSKSASPGSYFLATGSTPPYRFRVVGSG